MPWRNTGHGSGKCDFGLAFVMPREPLESDEVVEVVMESDREPFECNHEKVVFPKIFATTSGLPKAREWLGSDRWSDLRTVTFKRAGLNY